MWMSLCTLAKVLKNASHARRYSSGLFRKRVRNESKNSTAMLLHSFKIGDTSQVSRVNFVPILGHSIRIAVGKIKLSSVAQGT
jgi:hypothetical protein